MAASKDQPKERALILLMRYSGLAVRDAVTLRRDSVAGAELTLRRAKSGELVTVDLPDAVVRAMASIRAPSPDYFWWSGQGRPVTSAKYWRARLRIIADRAGVAGFRPHRLRDTFAVSLLGEGVAIGDVSTLLGHRSILTTERYYAPWNRSRRERLRRIVQEANRSDPVLADIDRRTSGVVPREDRVPPVLRSRRPPPEQTGPRKQSRQDESVKRNATDFDVGQPAHLATSRSNPAHARQPLIPEGCQRRARRVGGASTSLVR